MDRHSAAETYRQGSIENAPPIKIIRLLYQGALRFLDQAAKEDPANPQGKFNHFVHRADAIVSELRLAINQELADEVTENLERLYLYCEDELGKATVERSTEPVANARRILEILLEAWTHVEIETRRVA